MNEKDLKSMIESILNEMVGNKTEQAAEAVKPAESKAADASTPQKRQQRLLLAGLYKRLQQ
ncbi:hypothetical protein PAV_6c04940 [Paenibacillus alvei DSM 29]|uniref:hypothetical protein n=1 Tax=Paenibacillus alvei TaxID=44250 RepID=UPI0002887099|nr:hypothetical protein [Paenibacillus alvei]EJW16412.1 hypothetical protein PAV_6c04940 [Paenibacillus alvei DSM 29]